jgi:hypothetical protein
MGRGRLIVACVLGLIAAIGAIVYWRLSAEAPLVRQPLTQPTKWPAKLLGVWHDEYKGKRTMTLNDDGSGTMLVELEGVKAMLFAPKLRFDMKWHFEDGTLQMQTLGGEPEGKVNAILNLMGNTAAYHVKDVDDEHLLLIDQKDKVEYDWRRVK